MNKEVKIEIPAGYEIDKDKSTFEKIVFKEVEKELSYRDVCDKLFEDEFYFICSDGEIASHYSESCNIEDPNNSTTSQQLESILALNKLCNVAKYLNGDWLPSEISEKWFIQLVGLECKINVSVIQGFFGGLVYFKSKELVQQAIEILGEAEIKKALILNW